jgi:hypothetical protein
MTDRPRVKAGQAYRYQSITIGPCYVSDECPSDLPLGWLWGHTSYAPCLDDVELVRPYNDPTLLGNFLVDGDESFKPDELAAAKVDPRPGVVSKDGCPYWLSWEQRQLTQDETDALIYIEVRARCDPREHDELQSLFGPLRAIMRDQTTARYPTTVRYPLTGQRGGIHSEPLMRILAYRTWGDRDRLFDVEVFQASLKARIAAKRLRFDPPIHNIPRPRVQRDDPRALGQAYRTMDGQDRSPSEQRSAVRRGLAYALEQLSNRSPIVAPTVAPILGKRKP